MKNTTVIAECSFCGKPNTEVQKIIAGPAAVYICNECIDLSHEIIETEPQADVSAEVAAPSPERLAER